ncbi:hypothetical protein G7Y89_g2798 [Cudoniella acicularis]|uniref:Uncharacterized protein n=1 Tax=Cudoniella acicularis TaxID=354080 RepID=A0A8H4RSQ9_9HELO|nr:hypothetical protein G7Y89_g2798 [Cudoniella acicularis]
MPPLDQPHFPSRALATSRSNVELRRRPPSQRSCLDLRNSAATTSQDSKAPSRETADERLERAIEASPSSITLRSSPPLAFEKPSFGDHIERTYQGIRDLCYGLRKARVVGRRKECFDGEVCPSCALVHKLLCSMAPPTLSSTSEAVLDVPILFLLEFGDSIPERKPARHGAAL